MNEITIELCKREQYDRTTRLLAKDFGKRDLLGRLDNFIKYVNQAYGRNKEKTKSISKLSFDVSLHFFHKFSTYELRSIWMKKTQKLVL